MDEHSFWGKLLGEWLRPSGLVVLIGLVIWLIQLNFGFVANTKEIATLKETVKSGTEALIIVQRNADKTAIVLENVIKHQQETANALADYMKENQKWKERVILNEERLRGKQ